MVPETAVANTVQLGVRSRMPDADTYSSTHTDPDTVRLVVDQALLSHADSNPDADANSDPNSV